MFPTHGRGCCTHHSLGTSSHLQLLGFLDGCFGNHLSQSNSQYAMNRCLKSWVLSTLAIILISKRDFALQDVYVACFSGFVFAFIFLLPAKPAATVLTQLQVQQFNISDFSVIVQPKSIGSEAKANRAERHGLFAFVFHFFLPHITKGFGYSSLKIDREVGSSSSYINVATLLHFKIRSLLFINPSRFLHWRCLNAMLLGISYYSTWTKNKRLTYNWLAFLWLNNIHQVLF